jgi:hypothetical protein
MLPYLGTMRALLLAAALLAAPALAQVPDTTAAWRYFPLHVGNAWEYAAGGTTVIRRDIIGEETIGGRRYALWREITYVDGEIVGWIPPAPIRFDTLSSFVFENFRGEERPFGFAPCPFRVDFGATADCDPLQSGFRLYDVAGTYDGAVVLGGSPPDTVRTAVKLYDDQAFAVDFGYAAGLGEVYAESDIRTYGLYYARINGVEYGEAQITTGMETVPSGTGEGLQLWVWPNPSRGAATVALTLAQPGEAAVALFDALGRRVALLHEGVLAAGAHRLPLRASSLPPGVYVVRAIAGAEVAGASVVVAR